MSQHPLPSSDAPATPPPPEPTVNRNGRIPVIGEIGAGGVVTFYPGGREWLDAKQARLAVAAASPEG